MNAVVEVKLGVLPLGPCRTRAIMFQFLQEELVPETYPSFEDVKQIFDDASPGPWPPTFYPRQVPIPL